MRRVSPPEARGDRSASARREDLGAAIAGCAHAEREVFRHFEPQAGACGSMGDAVAQLPQRGLGERFVELGLPEQHDLQQLMPVGLEIGQ